MKTLTLKSYTACHDRRDHRELSTPCTSRSNAYRGIRYRTDVIKSRKIIIKETIKIFPFIPHKNRTISRAKSIGTFTLSRKFVNGSKYEYKVRGKCSIFLGSIIKDFLYFRGQKVVKGPPSQAHDGLEKEFALW